MSGTFSERDDDLEAAEYVLGTLDRDERARFADRLATDDEAKRAVAGWEERLAGLAGRVPALPPSPEIWDRIERALTASGSATMHPFKVIKGGGQSSETPGLRRSRDRWRMGALLSGALAACLLVFVGNMTLREKPPVEPSATYVAAVNRGGDKPALIVSVDFKTGKVLVRPIAAATPDGKSLELWYIGTDKTPRSMGVVDKASADLSLPAGTASNAATFAVTVEPPGGSKTGGPTGPIVYAGQLVKE